MSWKSPDMCIYSFPALLRENHKYGVWTASVGIKNRWTELSLKERTIYDWMLHTSFALVFRNRSWVKRDCINTRSISEFAPRVRSSSHRPSLNIPRDVQPHQRSFPTSQWTKFPGFSTMKYLTFRNKAISFQLFAHDIRKIHHNSELLFCYLVKKSSRILPPPKIWWVKIEIRITVPWLEIVWFLSTTTPPIRNLSTGFLDASITDDRIEQCCAP